MGIVGKDWARDSSKGCARNQGKTPCQGRNRRGKTLGFAGATGKEFGRGRKQMSGNEQGNTRPLFI